LGCSEHAAWWEEEASHRAAPKRRNNFIVENLFEFSLKDKDGPMNKFKDSLIDAVARKKEVNNEPTY